jgi:hypothetical protein
MHAGLVIGRLTLISPTDPLMSSSKPRGRWLCRCACGRELKVLSQNLALATRDASRGSRSCGCWAREVATKHGEAAAKRPTPEYQAWLSMKKRCYSPSNPSYADYGGRGIIVCDHWRHDFQAFLADMGRRPSPQHSLDRERGEDGYGPDNCRWADIGTQNRNRRGVNLFDFDGQQMSLGQISKRLGITRGQLRSRVKRGLVSLTAGGDPISVGEFK